MTIYDKDALIARLRTGARVKYLFFMSHRPRRPGAPLGAECFSQWHGSGFLLEGAAYPTAEHWMMAQKARLFGDAEAFERVLSNPEPGAAKAAGRAVRGFDQAVWTARREEIVLQGNRAKFAQNPDLGAFLRATGERVLVEAAPRDPIWGIGLGADHEDAAAPERWPGLNLLGFALMRVRAALGAA